MLFKTIEDEATLSGLRIQSIFGQVGNQISAMFSTKAMDFSGFSTSIESDIAAINNYIVALRSGQTQEEAFKATMVEASSAAQAYANSVNTASVSTNGFVRYAAMNKVSLEAQNKTLGNVKMLLNEYNSGMANCKLNQADFISAVGQSNSALGKYLTGLNGGKASMKGYITSLVGAKVASFALQAATMALNAALTMGISALVSWGISAFTELADAVHTSAEEIQEAAEEIRSSYETATSEINSNITTLTDLESEFNRLSKGVSEYGDNIYLTASEYQRYQDIVSQIVGISPTLCAGYDAEGKAIANKNGLIEKSIDLLKEKQRLELMEYVSDDALTTSGMAYVQDIKDFMKDNPLPYGNAKYDFIMAFEKAANRYADSKQGNYEGEIYDLLHPDDRDLNDFWTEGYWSEYGDNASAFAQDFYDQIVADLRSGDSKLKQFFTDSEIEALSKHANSYDDNMAVYNNRMNEYSKSLGSQLQLVASTVEGYDELSAAQKNVISSFINSDQFKLTDKTTEDDIVNMKYKIQDFVKTIQDGNVGNLINELFSLDKSNITEYTAKVDELIGKIADATGMDKESLTKDLGFGDVKALDAKIKAYNDLTEKILNCTDAQEKNKLIAEQNALGKEIEAVTNLITQYDGLTAAYDRWQAAQSSENEGTKYDTIAEGLEGMKDLYNKGLVGTDDFKTAVQLMSNQDLTNATVEQLMNAYEVSFPKMQRYFKEGQSGCQNFLNDISKLNSEWAHMNEDGSWEIDFNDEEVAEKLGISVGAVQAIMKKLKDFGFDIDLSSCYESLTDLKSATEAANDKLKELGKTEIDFDVNSTNIDDLIGQIDSASKILDTFKKEDGTVDLSVEGAQEAKTILAALIYQKQQVSEPAIIELNFNAETAKTEIESAALLVNDFRTKYRELEVKIATGEDTSALQTEIQGIINKIDEVPDEIKTKLGLDSESFTTAVETLTKDTVDVKAGITLDAAALATFNATLLNISPEMLVKAGLDDTLIKDYVPDEKSATVKYKVDDSAVKKYNPPNLNRTVYYTVKQKGDVGARGTAFAQGNWGASKSGIALGGELGQELVVRNGKFFTIGDEGAEFFNYQKDDIIFNAEQTKQIFEKGKISSGNRRGRALVEGTAFATGSGRFYTAGTPKTTKYVSPADSSTSPNPSTAPKTTTEKSNEETEFERQYKYHQHLLAMDRESVQDYLDWLVVAYKEAYDAGQMELDDFYKYEEEVYEKSKSLFDDLIKDSEHQISLWENQGGNEQNIINEYKEMQKAAHEQAEYYRTLGLSEENDKIQELQKLWWDCEKNIAEVITDTCDKTVSSIENSIDLAKKHLDDFVTVYDDGSAEEFSESIVSKYKDIQSELHEAADELRALGYSEDSAEIQDLQKQWWDAEEAKNDSLREIFDRRLELSEDYIERSKLLGWENGDTEIKARERILNWMSSDYYKSLFESEEEWQKAYLEQLEGYNDAVMSTIDKIHSDYSDAIDKINKEIDKQITREKALLDVKTKQYDAINRLTEAQHEADKAIADSRIAKAYLSDREYDLIYNEEDYAAVSKVIDDIDEDISLLTKNFNRQIENAYANGQEYLIENITAEYERQVELKMQELAIAQAELEVTKKQTELNNVLAERNIRQLVERNGKLEWEWVADTDKVRAATEALSDAEYQYEKAKDEKQQQINLNRMQENIDDFTDEQARNNKLVEQLGDTIDNIKKTIDDIENPIEGLTIDVKTLKEKGVVNFSKAIDQMVAKLGSVAINSASTAKQTTQSGFSSSSYSYGSGGGSSSRVTYDSSIDYMAQAQSAIKRGDDKAAASYLAKRDAKIDGEGLSYKKESLSDVKKKMGYASGTTHATKGWHEVDENGGETYITSDGKFHNFEGGEYVFDTEKTKTLYDLASKMTALSDGSLPLPVSKNNVPNSLSILQDQNNGGKGNSYSFGDIVVNNPADYNSFVKQLTNTIKKKTI